MWGRILHIIQALDNVLALTKRGILGWNSLAATAGTQRCGRASRQRKAFRRASGWFKAIVAQRQFIGHTRKDAQRLPGSQELKEDTSLGPQPRKSRFKFVSGGPSESSNRIATENISPYRLSLFIKTSSIRK